MEIGFWNVYTIGVIVIIVLIGLLEYEYSKHRFDSFVHKFMWGVLVASMLTIIYIGRTNAETIRVSYVEDGSIIRTEIGFNAYGEQLYEKQDTVVK